MKKSIMIVFIATFLLLILGSVFVIGLTEEEKKKMDEELNKKLKELGIESYSSEIGIEDVSLSNDLKTLTISKNGKNKFLDVSKVKEITINMNDGGMIRDINGNEYHTVKAKIKVVDGKIIINEKIELLEGTKINWVKVNTENKATFSIDKNGIIDSNGKDIVLSDTDGKLIGRLNGKAAILNENRIDIKTNGEVAEFVNYKGTKMSVTQDTSICHGKCDTLENKLDIDKIEYNGNLIVIPRNKPEENSGIKGSQDGTMVQSSKDDNLEHTAPMVEDDRLIIKKGEVKPLLPNKISIETSDTDYENVIVKRVDGDSKVDVKINGEDSDVVFKFSKGYPIVEGDIFGLKTSIGHMISKGDININFKGRIEKVANYVPWILLNGKELTEKDIGKINPEDGFEILNGIADIDVKKLLTLTLEGSGIRGTDFLHWALKTVKGDKELQSFIIDNLDSNDKLLSISGMLNDIKGSPDLQIKLIEKLKDNSISFLDHPSPLDTTKDNPIAQQMLIENFIRNRGLLQPLELINIDRSIKSNPNYEMLREMLLTRTDGIIYSPEEFMNLPEEERFSVLQKTTYFTTDSLSLALKSYSNGDPALESLIIDNFNFKEINRLFSLLDALSSTDNREIQERILKMYSPSQKDIDYYTKTLNYLNKNQKMDIFQGEAQRVREIIPEINPQILGQVMVYVSDYFDKLKFNPGWEKEIGDVFSNRDFLRMTEGKDIMEIWDIGLSAERRLKQKELSLSNENIKNAVEEIISYRNSAKPTEILSPDTSVFLAITNSEKTKEGKYAFQEDVMFDFARDSGVGEEALRGFKGPETKGLVLDALAYSKGDTTVWFNGHGGNNHIWLGEGQVGKDYSSDMHVPQAISYVELGDSLIARARAGESLASVNIVIDACYSYDFTTRLYNYLYSKGFDGSNLPTILTETNRGSLGISIYGGQDISVNGKDIYSPYQRAMYLVKKPGEPFTIGDVYKAQKYYFKYEDGAIFIPTENGIVPIGSPNDQEEMIYLGEPIELKDQTIPSVIEIGEIDSEMEYLFA